MDTGTSRRGTVVVTGTSTGIGRACALRLARSGYHVFAGVRRQADADELRDAHPGVTPLILDVTRTADIDAAAETVGAAVGGDGLVALVNNAGVGITSPSELVPLDRVRRQFEINVFGQLAMAQAFLPMIRRATGRIINIGSIGDRLTMPFGGPLNASKHALASFNDALRVELRPWGIHVVLVEPASIRTAAVDKIGVDGEKAIGEFTDEGRALYEDAYRSMLGNAMKHPRKYGVSPDRVGDVVLKAVTARTPKTRYLVGNSARPLATIAWLASGRTFDAIKVRVFDLPREFGSRSGEDASHRLAMPR